MSDIEVVERLDVKQPSEYYDMRTVVLTPEILQQCGIFIPADFVFRTADKISPMYQVLLCSHLGERVMNVLRCEYPYTDRYLFRANLS